MQFEAECFATLAHLLEPPDAAFHAQLAVMTDPTLVPATIAGNVALFAERVAGLSPDERRELFVETFAESSLSIDRRTLVASLRGVQSGDAASVLAAIVRLCTALSRDRNPYLHVCVAARSALGVT
jgi:hypothetical protein